MALITKREQVITALETGDYKEALKIAKGFNRDLTKDENTIVRRAYEMQWNEGFYTALGFIKEDEYEKAIKILKTVYKIEKV